MDDPRASSSEQTNALRGLAWIILPQESHEFFHTTFFRKAVYVIVIVSEKDRSSEGGDSCGKATAEDPTGRTFPRWLKSLPAESVRLERIRSSLFNEKTIFKKTI
ncbi:hypothetical protein CR203_11430 [Salipaludibacillus neizhouensis]|uniref:Uncharacterized protein n=1 Tax=Salipaludibacillus neizhouensis TaxID=885475 RepID=A0A3A9K8H1_9BACI|nr:hypothetical protein CR203_11430 [Salipaludibacillus neizhouensis]